MDILWTRRCARHDRAVAAALRHRESDTCFPRNGGKNRKEQEKNRYKNRRIAGAVPVFRLKNGG
jgi:hypothetical protein